MTDIAEAAEHQEQLARELAIKNHRACVERVRRDTCIDCGDKIPTQRISIRCVACQTELENKPLTWRR
jgi:RNA polymerase-binding transcription factor DksA